MYQKIKGLSVESQNLAKIQVIEIKRVRSYMDSEGEENKRPKNEG
jgi:hypothetical protein